MYWNVLMCFIIIIIGNKVQFLNPHVVSVARAALYNSVLCLSSRVKEKKTKHSRYMSGQEYYSYVKHVTSVIYTPWVKPAWDKIKGLFLLAPMLKQSSSCTWFLVDVNK